MFDNLDLIILLKSFCAVFLGGLIRGYAGFGFALVAAPLMSIFLPPSDVVPIMFLLAMAGGLQMLSKALKNADLKAIKILVFFSLIGMPLGTLALIKLAPDLIRLIIGISVLFAVFGLLGKLQIKLKPSNKIFAISGLISGFLNTSTSLDGPPVIICFLSMPEGERVGRSSLIVFFLINAVLGFLLSLFCGIVTKNSVLIALIIMPGLLIGNFIGDVFFDKMKGKNYQKFALAILFVIAILAIYNAAGSILF